MMTEPSSHRRLFWNYLLHFGTLGAFLPLFGVFFRGRGFSGTEVSVLAMAVPAVQILAPPVYGWLADTRVSRLTLYRLALATAVLLVPAFYWLERFWLLFGLIALYGLFRGPLVSLLNAATFELIDRIGGDFGRIRLGGSLGFIVFALLAGIWTDVAGLERLPDLLLVGGLLHLVLGWRAPMTAARGLAKPDPGAWRRFVRDPRWLLFLGGLALSRMAEQAYNVFYSVHLTDLGFSTSFAGAMWSLGVASEVVVLLWSHKILGRFRLEPLLTFTYLVAALRWAATSAASSAVTLGALQLAHGITFGLFYVTAVAWAHRWSPPGLSTSAQGVTNGTMFGVAGVLGQLVAGRLYDLGGGVLVFQVAAALAGASVLVAGLLRSLPTDAEQA